MKLFLQKNAKFSSAGGFAPKPPLASAGWGLRLQTPQTAPPLQISGSAPGLHTVKKFEFWRDPFGETPHYEKSIFCKV